MPSTATSAGMRFPMSPSARRLFLSAATLFCLFAAAPPRTASSVKFTEARFDFIEGKGNNPRNGRSKISHLDYQYIDHLSQPKIRIKRVKSRDYESIFNQSKTEK